MLEMPICQPKFQQIYTVDSRHGDMETWREHILTEQISLSMMCTVCTPVLLVPSPGGISLHAVTEHLTQPSSVGSHGGKKCGCYFPKENLTLKFL